MLIIYTSISITFLINQNILDTLDGPPNPFKEALAEYMEKRDKQKMFHVFCQKEDVDILQVKYRKTRCKKLSFSFINVYMFPRHC